MGRGNIVKLIASAVLIAGIVWAVVNRDKVDLAQIETALLDFGVWAPIVFVTLFAAATVVFLPGTVFALAGGALFGPVWGTLFNLAGATIGAVIAFLAAQIVASDWIRARTGQKLERLIAGVESEGWRFVAFVRLVPIFPFNLANYAFGLTRIGLVPYTITTFLAMIPGALAYTYLGYLGREALAGGEGLVQKGMLALALLTIVVFSPRFIRILRQR